VYEPLGIVNLEAMACGAAVVGTATGGIPEVVVDGVTGRLVPIEQVQDGTGTPVDPDRFVADLAAVLTDVVSDPERARAYGEAGRERAATAFSWQAIADATEALYREVAERRTERRSGACRRDGSNAPIGWGHASGARVRRCRRPPQRSQHHRSHRLARRRR
jgi:glycogen synthase